MNRETFEESINLEMEERPIRLLFTALAIAITLLLGMEMLMNIEPSNQGQSHATHDR
jgi:hypothetical protein